MGIFSKKTPMERAQQEFSAAWKSAANDFAGVNSGMTDLLGWDPSQWAECMAHWITYEWPEVSAFQWVHEAFGDPKTFREAYRAAMKSVASKDGEERQATIQINLAKKYNVRMVGAEWPPTGMYRDRRTAEVSDEQYIKSVFSDAHIDAI